MKKAALALSILAASTSAAWAQSSVTIYGIVDAAVRLSTNAGATAATNGESITSVVPGGMSQSRLGFNITEDMGGGLKAIANMEHRFNSDTGAASAADFWRQSWVGLQSSEWGRVTIGRQYNVLFDAYTPTYSSFRYSPYIEAFKPEVGFSLGARNDNMVKYLIEVGGFRAEAQVSAGEGNATTVGANGKSMGGLLRYATGEFAAAGAYLQLEDTAGKNVKGWTVGGSWSSGPWYVNASWGRNEFETGFNPTLNITLLGSIAGALTTKTPVATGGAGDERDIYMAGFTYQMTPQWNLGLEYWHTKQDGLGASTAADGKTDSLAFVADYAFSKRTDAYLEIDGTKVGGNLMFANGASKRQNYMIGLRHRF
ncbi:porin [Roseateles violae]|uniref:Porin n=1 Tax=Roseateles violae TaxID=3058042 RepID=A0ABT8DS36_9BURK|nr:porin [Pelomonas sp. PFR6]MDN3921140.1 porin [Pelomonas sp. PFR6]